MKALYYLILTFLLISLSYPLGAEVKIYNEAVALYKKAHIEFIKLNYDEAINYYSDVEKFLEKNQKYKQYFDHHYRNFSMIDVVKKHKNLGNFKPILEHKILVLYLKNTDTQFEGKSIKTVFTDELKETAYISQEVCKRLIEVLSNGEMTVSFERLEINAYVSELSSSLSESNNEEIKIIQPVIESFHPYPWETIYKNIDFFDTYIFYWNDNRLKSGDKGGAKALGGAANLPIFPYQLYSPKRGRIIISASLLDRPGTLLHELFHTIESRLGVKPIHGFSDQDRKHFPFWKGKGEFDYYAYHFDNFIKENKIKDLEFIKSSPNFLNDKIIETNLNIFKNIPYSELCKSQKLYIRATELLKNKNNQKKAVNLFEKILEINPYHLNTLIRLCVINHNNNDKLKALDFIIRAYQINPANGEVCYWMGVEHYNQKIFDSSIKYLSEGLNYDPLSSVLLQYRSFVYYQNKNYPEAEKDFEVLLKISSDNKKWIVNFLEGKIKQKDSIAEGILKKLKL